eukprot:6856217-Alexandrium_andersonii.AAC.1
MAHVVACATWVRVQCAGGPAQSIAWCVHLHVQLDGWRVMSGQSAGRTPRRGSAWRRSLRPPTRGKLHRCADAMSDIMQCCTE